MISRRAWENLWTWWCGRQDKATEKDQVVADSGHTALIMNAGALLSLFIFRAYSRNFHAATEVDLAVAAMAWAMIAPLWAWSFLLAARARRQGDIIGPVLMVVCFVEALGVWINFMRPAGASSFL